MPGSLFREWKVALGFVGGIAILAGAFVSEGGEHRYFAELGQRRAAAEPEPTPPAAVARPAASPAPAPQTDPGQLAADDELENQLEDLSEAGWVAGPGGLPTALAADPAAMAEAGNEAEGSAPEPPAFASRTSGQEPGPDQ